MSTPFIVRARWLRGVRITRMRFRTWMHHRAMRSMRMHVARADRSLHHDRMPMIDRAMIRERDGDRSGGDHAINNYRLVGS